MQLDEHNAILNNIDQDIKTNDTMCNEMVPFCSKMFGYENHAWVQVVRLKWSKKRSGLVFDGSERKRAAKKAVPPAPVADSEFVREF